MLDPGVSALLLVVALVGLRLVAREVPRLHREPKRRETLSGEDASHDWFHATVVAMIAIVSIAGALLSYRAASVYGAAQGRSQGANAALARGSEVSGLKDNLVEFGALQTQQLQQHVAAAIALDAQAATLRAKSDAASATAADVIEAEASQERAMSRIYQASFIGGASPTRQVDGTIVYNPDQVRLTLKAFDIEYRTLDGDQSASITASDSLRHHARLLVGIGLLLSATLFFLTLANLAPMHRRLWLFLPALGAVIGALVGFITVQKVL